MAVSDYLDSMDFTTLRDAILNMAPDDVDKSEGSFMYDAVTPIALFVSEMFSQMKLVLEQSFIGTATGTNLDTIAATMPRLYREQATSERLTLRLSASAVESVRSIILSSQNTLKFSNSDGEQFTLNTDAEDWITVDSNNVYVKVIKSVTGKGTSFSGQTFEPAPSISGVTSCSVYTLDAQGGDAETDDHFRVRIWAAMSSPFLGSVADYQRKIFAEFPSSENGFEISNCFIIPRGSRSGYICIIPVKTDSSTNVVEHCSEGELTSLQNYLDKRIDGIGGYGMGVAPIGHVIRVRDFTDYNMRFSVTVIVAHGRSSEVSSDTVSEQVTNATNSYITSIINEVVPSSTNYRANPARYVTFFIYYYLNAHEYTVLSALRSTYGSDLIKSVTVNRINYVDGEPVIVEQNDVVIKSGDSKGTLPVASEIEVVIQEAEG